MTINLNIARNCSRLADSLSSRTPDDNDIKRQRDIIRSNCWRRIIFSALSGVLLVLCFPHADLGWLAWAALVPFFLTFPKDRFRDALLHGFVLGFVFYGGALYWIAIFASEKAGSSIGWISLLLAAVFHSSVLIFFSALCYFVWRRSLWAKLIAVPAAWALCEWVGELGPLGLGWGDLGYSQWTNIPILQLSSIAGVFGLSFFIVFINLSIASRNSRAWAFAALLFALLFLWGKVESKIDPALPKVTVAAVQGNINQDVKWTRLGRPQNLSYFYNTLDTFDSLTSEAAAKGAHFVLLPETAIPGFIQQDGELLGRSRSWATKNDCAILAGGNYTDEKAKKCQNVVFMFSPQGDILGRYAKCKLAPFGEFLPYPELFSFLGPLRRSFGDLEPGGEFQPSIPSSVALTDGKQLVVGPMICYESTYSRFARRQAIQGADILAVSTDDTWFGKTAAAKQHLAMSAMRAAETRRSLVRSAATGISAIFDSRGRMLKSMGLFRRGVLVCDVPVETDLTLFDRYGDCFVIVCGAAWFLALLFAPRRICLH
jgi:apolipoprotein N-acyltransferase